MEQVHTLLALVEHPAFCVADGKVLAVNAAAQKLFITEGTELSGMLPQDQAVTYPPKGGYLYLTLQLSDTPFGASVFYVEDKLLFILEDENEDARLQALALASQQLRQPLSGILSVMESLSENDSLNRDPRLQDQLAQMNQRLFQMLRMVTNMSDVYRYRTDGIAQGQTVNISGLFYQLLESAQDLTCQAGRKLCFTQPRQAIFSLAERNMLERAFYNLLSNAIKFSPEGSTITANLTQKGTTIYLTLENPMQGLPAELRSDIFSRYTRQPGIEDGRFGLGLGLSLVRTAALAHGGTLLMEQPNSESLKVTMAFPVRQSSQTNVRAHILCVDHAGELPHGLLELADVLHADAFYDIY